MSDGATGGGAPPGTASRRTRALGHLGGALLAAAFVAFVAFALSRTATIGLCCGDDSFFASTAKNVATGLGYGVTVTGEGFKPVYHELSVGPPLILPAAAAIRLLGNRHWVPGAATIAVWATLLVLVHRRLRARPEVRNLRLASVVFLAGLVLLFPLHYEHWYTLLGEVPAALMILLAVVVLGGSALSARTVAAASLLCSLAYLTKAITALFCLGFVAALAVRVLLEERRTAREALRLALASLAALVVPVLAFEAFKIAALGGLGPYREYLASLGRWAEGQGIRPTGSLAARLKTALEYDGGYAARFGVRASIVGLTVVASAVGLARVGAPVQRRVAVAIAAGVLLNVAYFLFVSIGWPRYFIVATVLAWALVVLVLTRLRPSHAVALGSALLLFFFVQNHRKLPQLSVGVERGPFAKSPALVNALDLAAFIDANRKAAPFATQWWATTADLEYYARSTDVFRKYQTLSDRDAYYVVFKRQFRYEPDAVFNALVAACAPPARSFEPYALLRCGPSGPSLPAGPVPAERR